MRNSSTSFSAIAWAERGVANDVQLNALPHASALRLDDMDVRKLKTNSKPMRCGLALVAVLLMALVLQLSYFAADSGAHKHIHHHADESTHQCAITLFAGGHALALTPQAVTAVVVLGVFLLAGIALSSGRPSVRHLLPFSCGPPV